MYCSQLSMLKDYLVEEQIITLQDYFFGLTANSKNKITASKIMSLLKIDNSLSKKVLMMCKNKGILAISYGIRCPECGFLIKQLDEFPLEMEEYDSCYACEEDIEITANDIEIIFTFVEGSIFFNNGQQIINIKDVKSKTNIFDVAHTNSLDSFIKSEDINLNHEFFNPKDAEYDKLLQYYNDVIESDTTTNKGRTLEKLVLYLFNLSKFLKAGEIKTATNQFDCYVRNTAYVPYGVFNLLGFRFVIECKNEKKTPKGTYISKLHSIINVINASDSNIIKFGIIVSKAKPPSTYKALAIKYYLSNKILLISITLDDIKDLIDSKGNIFELIEEKCDDIILEATSDLKKAGIY